MPDLAEPARNAYRGDVLRQVPLAFMRRCGANWHCYAIDSKTGLNRAVRVYPCAAWSVEVRSPALFLCWVVVQ